MIAKTYSLISVGKRGAGKTVFLSGIFAALQKEYSLTNNPSFWLDSDDQDTKDNIGNILAYIAKTGNYPPATLRLNHFAFSLHQRMEDIEQTLCQFYWWDAPGESCRLYNPAFVSMISQADGGCFFIDANELLECVKNNLEDGSILNQLDTLATVIAHNCLTFPLAIVLTKCDLFSKDTPSWQELNYRLFTLKQKLSSLAINYQIFYSSFIINTVDKKNILYSKTASKPLLWLLKQIQTNHAKTVALSNKEINEQQITKTKTVALSNKEVNEQQIIKEELKFYGLPWWIWIWLSILLIVLSISVISLIKIAIAPEPRLPDLSPTQPSHQNQ